MKAGVEAVPVFSVFKEDFAILKTRFIDPEYITNKSISKGDVGGGNDQHAFMFMYCSVVMTTGFKFLVECIGTYQWSLCQDHGGIKSQDDQPYNYGIAS